MLDETTCRNLAQNNQHAKSHLKNALRELRLMVEAAQNLTPGKEVWGFYPFKRNNNFSQALFNINDDDEASYCQNIDEYFWTILLDISGILDKCTTDKRNALKEKIHKKQWGTFTFENIRKLLDDLKNHEQEFSNEVILNTYRALTERFTAKAPDIPVKSIIISREWDKLNFRGVNTEKWDNLEKTFCLLDGRIPPANHSNTLSLKLADTYKTGNLEYEDEYFKMKFYETACSVHVIFKRLDLLRHLNEIGRQATL